MCSFLTVILAGRMGNCSGQHWPHMTCCPTVAARRRSPGFVCRPTLRLLPAGTRVSGGDEAGRTAVDVVSIARLRAGDKEAAPCLGRDQRRPSTTRTIGSRNASQPTMGEGPSRAARSGRRTSARPSSRKTSVARWKALKRLMPTSWCWTSPLRARWIGYARNTAQRGHQTLRAVMAARAARDRPRCG